MKLFLVAVPMFDRDMAVQAYMLNYRSSEKLFGTSGNYAQLDGAMNSPGIELLEKIGLEPFTGGKPIFVPVTKFLLLADISSRCSIAPELMGCVFTNDIPNEEEYISKIVDLKSKGYWIAIENIDLTVENEIFYRLADYVIFDATSNLFSRKFTQFFNQYPNKRAVFSNVNRLEIYDQLKIHASFLFQGKFFNQPFTKGTTKVSPVKANALHLLKIVGEENFDLEEVGNIINKDPAIALSLMKFVNSPAIRTGNKVNSLKNAVALLGQNEIRKWITVTVSSRLAEDKPNELAKLSLVRAKFAENLSGIYSMDVHSSSLFIMGLFSLLDVILDKTMQEALEEISVNDKVRDALQNHRGEFADILKMIYAYEQADWSEVSYMLILKNISAEDVSKAFIDALVWYRDLLKGLSADDELD